MYRREHRDQLSFKDFFLPFGGQLSGDNRWIKLAELIPWDELEDDYAAQFCKGFGAPASACRSESAGPRSQAIAFRNVHPAATRSALLWLRSSCIWWHSGTAQNKAAAEGLDQLHHPPQLR